MKQFLVLIIFILIGSCAAKKEAHYIQLGKQEMANQRVDEAVKLFTKAIQLNPANAEAFFLRGLSHNFMKDYAPAIADFNRAEELQYSDSKLYTLRAYAHGMTGKNEFALQDLNKAIAMDPEAYAGNYYNRAMLYNTLQKPDSAVADLNSYLNIAEDPYAYFQRGKIVLSKGDLTKACEDFKKAVSLGNTDAELLKVSQALCK